MSRQVPLQFLTAGTEFTLPAGGNTSGGVLLDCPPEADAKVSVNGQVQYWAAATQVTPGRTRQTQPVSVPESGRRVLTPATQQGVSTMATTTTKTTPKASTKATTAPSANGNGHAKKDGLRSAQVRILAYLAKTKTPATRSDIATGAPCDPAMSDSLGTLKEGARDYGYPSLIQLGAVKAERRDVDGKDVLLHTITAKGRQLLAAAEKAAKQAAK